MRITRDKFLSDPPHYRALARERALWVLAAGPDGEDLLIYPDAKPHRSPRQALPIRELTKQILTNLPADER